MWFQLSFYSLVRFSVLLINVKDSVSTARFITHSFLGVTSNLLPANVHAFLEFKGHLKIIGNNISLACKVNDKRTLGLITAQLAADQSLM